MTQALIVVKCYYKVSILCKNCDLRISTCLCYTDVLQNH